MQVFHTAGEPPNKGNSNLPNKGCRTNISDALTNNVPANKIIKDKRRSELSTEGLLIIFVIAL